MLRSDPDQTPSRVADEQQADPLPRSSFTVVVQFPVPTVEAATTTSDPFVPNSTSFVSMHVPRPPVPGVAFSDHVATLANAFFPSSVAEVSVKELPKSIVVRITVDTLDCTNVAPCVEAIERDLPARTNIRIGVTPTLFDQVLDEVLAGERLRHRKFEPSHLTAHLTLEPHTGLDVEKTAILLRERTGWNIDLHVVPTTREETRREFERSNAWRTERILDALPELEGVRSWRVKIVADEVMVLYDGRTLSRAEIRAIKPTLPVDEGAPITFLRRFGQTQITKDIENLVPRGVEVWKTSFFDVPLGHGNHARVTVLRAHVPRDLEPAVKQWISNLEKRHDITVILHKEPLNERLKVQLSDIADLDGLVRDPARVEAARKRIHGPVPRSFGKNEDQFAPPEKLRDLTPMRKITIDPPMAEDLDDAVWAKKLANGNVRVVLSFADVSWRIPPGSIEDRGALKAGFTLYGRHSVLPMISSNLAFSELSLLPGKERVAWTVDCEVMPDGKIARWNFYRSLIKSEARYSFEEAQEILQGRPDPRAHIFRALYEATRRLRGRRLDKVRFFEIHAGESHSVIQEAMILARRVIGKFAHIHKLGVLYRVQAPPKSPQRREFVKRLGEVGIKVTSRELSNAKRFGEILSRLQEGGHQRLFRSLLDSFLVRARYDAETRGHSSLGVRNYAEIKALRNYAGLYNQYRLACHFEGRDPSFLAPPTEVQDQINRKEQCYDDNTFRHLTFEAVRDVLLRRTEPLIATISGYESDDLALIEVPGLTSHGLIQTDWLGSAAKSVRPGIGAPISVTIDGYDPGSRMFVFVPASGAPSRMLTALPPVFP